MRGSVAGGPVTEPPLFSGFLGVVVPSPLVDKKNRVIIFVTPVLMTGWGVVRVRAKLIMFIIIVMYPLIY